MGSPDTAAADDGVSYIGAGVPPPPLPPFWRKTARYLRALPVCRTCAVSMKMQTLTPYPEEGELCQAQNCENRVAYLAII